MDLHPAVQIAFLVVIGGLTAVAVVWLWAALGTWMDDAFDAGRWIWFGLLLLLTFPTGLIAWLIVRAMRKRPSLSA